MRATVLRNRRFIVDDVPDPVPAAGQVLVRTLACGICGSDLHAFRHMDQFIEASRKSGARMTLDAGKDLIFGHEYCAEVVAHGPGTVKKLRPGTRVCSVPLMVTPSETHPGHYVRHVVGYSNVFPGGFAQYMLLNEALLLEVPEGVPPEHAALTEPMAVGLHAVEKAALTRDDVVLVVGCGPIGLAVIAALKLKGITSIIASDFSQARRRHAFAMGADIVVDPAAHSPYKSWIDAATPAGYDADSLGVILGTGPTLRPGVIFECVGVPGIIQQMLEGAMARTRIVIVGVCMEPDRIEPLFGVRKELGLQFVIGYTPDEFAATLRHIADGTFDVAKLITGRVGLDGVGKAFADLADPQRHVKVLVRPWG